MIGIIGAMPEEISILKQEITDPESKVFATMEFTTGTIEDLRVVLLHSGIGKVNAAIATQIMIDKFAIDRILFTGLAGSLVANLKVGDFVVSNFVVQYDFDLTAFGRRLGEVPDIGRTIEADPDLVKLVCYGYDDIFKYENGSPDLMVGTIASGDRFVSDKRKIEWLQREFGAVATEMEGAAVGYTCHLNKVPFVIIRTISDSAGSEAVVEFDKFLSNASDNSSKIIRSILKVMSYKDTLT